MGCGKSKHSVETTNTIVKSTNSGCTKETATTKTVAEQGHAAVIVETKSVFVQDSNKNTAKTKVEPNDSYETNSVGPRSADNIENSEVSDNVMSPPSKENTGNPVEVIEEDDTVKDLNTTLTASTDSNPNMVAPLSKDDEGITTLTATSDANPNMVSPLNKDDVGMTNVVKKDETLVAEIETKIEKVSPKESEVTKDNVTKTEFMTPTLSEDVVGPFKVAKEEEEVRVSKGDDVEGEISDEMLVKTVKDSSNVAKDDNLKIEEQKIVVSAVESTKVETKKDKDVEVTEADIANVKTSLVVEQEKVPIADEVNVAETNEKETKTI